MNDNHKKCLVLNADYSPLTIINWKKALIWSVRHEYNKNIGIEIIDFYKNDYIIGVNKKYPIPAVAKSAKYLKTNRQSIKFCRKNIFIRDNYTCQYCGKQKDNIDLTYDHVIPKSQWKSNLSPTSWTNIVTACVDCNRKKGNRTPKVANMPLKNIPIMPQKSAKYLPITTYLTKIKHSIPSEWDTYLPDSYLI